MPLSNKGHKFILCIIDEVTNYLIMVPIYQSKAEEIGDTLIEHVVTKYCVPDCVIMDQDSVFMSSLMNYLFNKLDIKIKQSPLIMLCNPNCIYIQIFSIQCEHCYDHLHKGITFNAYIFSLLPHIFTINGELGSSKLPTNA